MNLSSHFTLEELTFSETAVRHGIDNTPTPAIVERLKHTALGLEGVRVRLCAPILVSSGYRSQALERVLKRKPPKWVSKSDHVKGDAVDFISPGFGGPGTVVCALLDAGIPFDQLILELGRWVHMSFAPSMRGEVLATDDGVRYRSFL